MSQLTVSEARAHALVQEERFAAYASGDNERIRRAEEAAENLRCYLYERDNDE